MRKSVGLRTNTNSNEKTIALSLTLLMIFSTLILFSMASDRSNNTVYGNESLIPEDAYFMALHNQGTLNYADGGMHLASGTWWQRPLPFNVTNTDWDGDGVSNQNDTHPTNPAIPTTTEVQPYACSVAHLPCHNESMTPSFSSNSDWDPQTTEKSSEIAWADIDGDGDLDLIRVNKFTGSNQYNIALGDINADGLPDAVVSDYTRTRIYLNYQGMLHSDIDVYLTIDGVLSDTVTGGGGPSSVWNQMVSSYNGVELGDVDGDGDIDLAICSTNEARIYLNGGSAISSTAIWSQALTSPKSIALGDVDGDGDLDLAVGFTNAPIKIYLNNGNGFSSTNSWETSSNVKNSDLEWGDINGDGLIDLVSASASENNKIFFNHQLGLITTPGWYSYGSYSSGDISLGDVNGDGFLDMLVGNRNQVDRLYMNLNGELQRNSSWQSSASDYTFSTSMADSDGDGDLDIAIGSEDSVRLYFNRGSVLSSQSTWQSTSNADVNSIAFGDLDGDGWNEMVTNHGTIELFRNNGGTYNGTSDWDSDTSSSAIALGDMDNDGDLDIISARSGTSYIYLNNNGIFQNSSKIAFGSQSISTSIVAVGDVDGDGDLDIAIGGHGSTSVQEVFMNNGGAFNSTSDWNSGGGRAYDIKLADVNGNGFPEFIFADYFTGRINIYSNNNGQLSNTNPTILSVLNPRSFDAGDFDNDGDLDIIAGSWGGGVTKVSKVFVNTNGNFQTQITLGKSGKTTDTIWADIDGDGDLDIIESFGGDRAYIYINDDGVITTSYSWQTDQFGEMAALAVTDINNDGMPDLAIGGTNDQTSIHFGSSDLDVDGVADVNDDFILNPTQSDDPDGDGFGDNQVGRLPDSCTGYWGDSWRDRWGCADEDSDGQSNLNDDFWNKGTQWLDSDGDGLGDNWGNSSWSSSRLSGWPGEFVLFAYNSDPSPLDYDNDGFEDPMLITNGASFPYDNCPIIHGTSTNDQFGCSDSDGDGWSDTGDSHPGDQTQHRDRDNDGYGDNSSGNLPDSCKLSWGNSTTDVYGCTDADGDGVSNLSDFDDGDANEFSDMDGDGHGDAADKCRFAWGNVTSPGDLGCPDRDGDGVADRSDDLPNDPSQWLDSDGDGFGDYMGGSTPDSCPTIFGVSRLSVMVNGANESKFGCTDTDNDGYEDLTDPCPFQFGNSWVDRFACPDTDLDGISDANDPYPTDPASSDSDWDGDGVADTSDAFPSDKTQHSDVDGDGFGDNSAGSSPDAFVNDPTQWSDFDGDGYGDNQEFGSTSPDHCIHEVGNSTDTVTGLGCPDGDGDGVADRWDAFEDDKSQWQDTDQDGYGDNQGGTAYDSCPLEFGTSYLGPLGCPDTDRDGWSDIQDSFDTDPTQSMDSDSDGYGDSSVGYHPDACPTDFGESNLGDIYGCLDSDGDGWADSIDVFPNDSTAWSDTDEDGFPDQLGSDNFDDCPGVPGYSEEYMRGCPDFDGDSLPDIFDDDIDGDGITNSLEAQSGFNPWDANSVPGDADGDRIPDIIDPDDDNDGFPDGVEYDRGSDPFDASENPINMYGGRNLGFYYSPTEGFSSSYVEGGIEISLSIFLGLVQSEMIVIIIATPATILFARRKNIRFNRMERRLEGVESLAEIDECEDEIDELMKLKKIHVDKGIMLITVAERMRRLMLENADGENSDWKEEDSEILIDDFEIEGDVDNNQSDYELDKSDAEEVEE
ncbi:MAG TPA: VCBS repeat-containing protein [Candidatus Poseidoniales archaeon]|nr:MAG: hypothetical protein CXX80_10010 [Euryarchaeota archaeon]HHZ73791.1 VCBS repeat-containing protein [Candidatus Poseidoniales archaeon]HIO25057.1 VCBS repeat-containing protein [Candidatus Poseidoniales archaeon]